MTLNERIEAFEKNWRAAQEVGDEDSLAKLRLEGQAIGVAVRATKPEAGTADGGDVNATAKLDEAITKAVGAKGKAAFDAWMEVPEPKPQPRRAVAVPDVAGERPAALLRLTGATGAVLSLGTVGVLSGAGGVGKSALTASLALSLADAGEGVERKLGGAMFDAPIGGGPVLMATWEDAPAVTRWRIEAAAKLLKLGEGAARHVFLMDMAGAPLYGPRAGDGGESDEGGGRPGLYNARPEPLPGWDDLWREVERTKPRLVVIDPVLSAFVGNSNEAAPVREFLSALSVAATERNCAVLLVAHSTKAARSGRNQDPDPFDPGHVGGSAAWTDGVRSALILDKDDDREKGAVRLAVAKSNYGPSKLLLPLERVKVGGNDAENRGATVAYRSAGSWGEHDPKPNNTGRRSPNGRNQAGKGGDSWNDEKLNS